MHEVLALALEPGGDAATVAGTSLLGDPDTVPPPGSAVGAPGPDAPGEMDSFDAH